MRSTALTIPGSYSETFQASRPADASAFRTGLGSPSFLGFDIHRPPSGSLVSQHSAEAAPTGIEHGFRHPCLCKFGSVHIADDDQTIFIRQPLAGDVKKVLSPVRDFGMNRPNPFLISGTLGTPEAFLFCSVKARRFNLAPVAHCGEGFETEINSDLAITGRKIVGNLALKRHVPAPASILDESASLEGPLNLTVLPEPESTPKISQFTGPHPYGARNKRHPTQRPFGALAGSKSGAAPMRIAAHDELATDGGNRVRVNAEVLGNAGRQFDQIEGRRPAEDTIGDAATLGFSLCGNAEVPDKITATGMPFQVLSGNRIFDAKFECDDTHYGSALLHSEPIKSASFGPYRAACSPFVPQLNINSNGTRFIRRLKAGVSARVC